MLSVARVHSTLLWYKKRRSLYSYNKPKGLASLPRMQSIRFVLALNNNYKIPFLLVMHIYVLYPGQKPKYLQTNYASCVENRLSSLVN